MFAPVMRIRLPGEPLRGVQGLFHPAHRGRRRCLRLISVTSIWRRGVRTNAVSVWRAGLRVSQRRWWSTLGLFCVSRTAAAPLLLLLLLLFLSLRVSRFPPRALFQISVCGAPNPAHLLGCHGKARQGRHRPQLGRSPRRCLFRSRQVFPARVQVSLATLAVDRSRALAAARDALHYVHKHDPGRRLWLRRQHWRSRQAVSQE